MDKHSMKQASPFGARDDADTASRRTSGRRLLLIGALAVPLGLLAMQQLAVGRSETGVMIAAPAVDSAHPADNRSTETAVFAGGCFWGVQGVFQHVEGVTRVVSGYAGGNAMTAHYEMVGTGMTGHAESVEITYDPRKVSYGALLQIFFSVAHDPTQVGGQGPDRGSQYRSAIFPRDAEQLRVAQAYVAQLEASHAFQKPITTALEQGKSFYPAEGYHQDFLEKNPRNPYIMVNDQPKVEQLKQLYPQRWRAMAVLTKAP